ncbi:MAG: hypothetical protein QM767_16740 [Anaeromyxobacter sp.]
MPSTACRMLLPALLLLLACGSRSTPGARVCNPCGGPCATLGEDGCSLVAPCDTGQVCLKSEGGGSACVAGDVVTTWDASVCPTFDVTCPLEGPPEVCYIPGSSTAAPVAPTACITSEEALQLQAGDSRYVCLGCYQGCRVLPYE